MLFIWCYHLVTLPSFKVINIKSTWHSERQLHFSSNRSHLSLINIHNIFFLLGINELQDTAGISNAWLHPFPFKHQKGDRVHLQFLQSLLLKVFEKLFMSCSYPDDANWSNKTFSWYSLKILLKTWFLR